MTDIKVWLTAITKVKRQGLYITYHGLFKSSGRAGFASSPVFPICAKITKATVCSFGMSTQMWSFHSTNELITRVVSWSCFTPQASTFFTEFRILILLQGFVFLCTKPCPAGLHRFLLAPSPRPGPRTSTCPTWARATTERAQTSTAWWLRRTCDPHTRLTCSLLCTAYLIYTYIYIYFFAV